MKIKLLFLVIIIVAVWARLWKLETSTHFLSDESRDLVNIHQIWVEKKLTLVGPISDDRSHVFSSLTYYMLLPFAVLFNFDPLGTVTGAAVWGLIVWGLVVLTSRKFNRKEAVRVALLAAIWSPLVTTSRWPWNPNLLLFWLFLGINLSGVFAGLAFGLAVHHHYLALVPAVLIIIKKKDWKVAAGVILALLPFAIFDLRHPPGIFITRMIDYNRGVAGISPLILIHKLPAIFNYFVSFIFGPKIVAAFGALAVVALALWDMVKKTAARGWLAIWTVSLLPLVLYSQQFQYLLPAIPFMVMWLITVRNSWGERLAKLITLLLITGSVLTLPMQFTQPDWQGNLKILRGAAKIIGGQITSQNLKNPNLAVLGSPDIYPDGKKYRDLLLVSNIRVKPYEEYAISDNLFVITMSDEMTLRRDPALEMMYFRSGPVAGVWQIPETKWKVIQFNRY